MRLCVGHSNKTPLVVIVGQLSGQDSSVSASSCSKQQQPDVEAGKDCWFPTGILLPP